MKNSNRLSDILLRALCLSIVLFYVVACNVLKEDPDNANGPSLTGKEVYVRAKGSSVINLGARVTTTSAATLSVTSQPTHGTLRSLGNGLLLYGPDQLSARTKDVFQYTLFDANHNAMEVDSIVLIVTEDSTKFPCGLYLNEDDILVTPFNSTFKDLLANDNLCGYDSNQYVVSIYKPTAQFGPHLGVASISNNRYLYYQFQHPTGTDSIIYKVQSLLDSSVVAYGLIKIEPYVQPAQCFFPADDDFSFNYDSITSTVAHLRSFDNDVLCPGYAITSSYYQVGIRNQPQHGTAMLASDTSAINYYPSYGLIPHNSTVVDTIHYQICADRRCAYATTIVRVTRQ